MKRLRRELRRLVRAEHVCIKKGEVAMAALIRARRVGLEKEFPLFVERGSI